MFLATQIRADGIHERGAILESIQGILRRPPANVPRPSGRLAFGRAELGCIRRVDDPGQDDSAVDRAGDLGPEQCASIAGNSAILKPGHRLGPYRLLARLGQGGQGEVWKTRRLGPTEELVALKVLKPELAHNPARMAQFRREAQRGPRLIGPSLLAGYELCEIDGFHCMTMPFVEGTALRDIIKWRLSYVAGEDTENLHSFVNMDEPDYQTAMVRALADASRARADVHDQHIAHRDVKPANLLLDNNRTGRVYLCDFGLGRDLDVATSEQMRNGAGTPIYMAPERLLMFTADEIKCDIYSMGVTLFEAITLEKPFRVPAYVTARASRHFWPPQSRGLKGYTTAICRKSWAR